MEKFYSLKSKVKHYLVLWLLVIMILGNGAGSLYGEANESVQVNLSKIYVSLNLKNVSFETFFNVLKEKSDAELYISYLVDDIKNIEPVTVNQTNVSVETIFNTVLKESGLTYTVKGNIISLVKVQQPKQQILKGKITSGDKKNIAGALVLVVGSQNGAITNEQGEFSINTTQQSGMVEISCIGFATQKVAYSVAMPLNVVLQVQEMKIDEVIVQGYGTTTVKDATGSVSRLNAKEIEMAPMTSSVQSLLQGRAAGVNVAIQSASPTSPVNVVIRGVSTLTGNTQPLWVIDGVPDYSSNTSGDISNSLFNLNLSDIESIDILKDVSATAIYGSRAANGVVIVTTKRGSKGLAPTIDLSVKTGIQTVNSNGLRALNAEEYKQFVDVVGRQSIFNSGAFDYNTRFFFDEAEFNKLGTSQWDMSDLKMKKDAFMSGDTDWWKEMTQNAVSTQYDISLKGGTESTNYYASFGYNRQNGVVKGGLSELYSARLNFETLVGKSVKIGLNISGSQRTTNNKDALVSKIIGYRPDQPAYNPDGSINIVPNDTTIENPLLTLSNRNDGRGQNLLTSAYLEWSIFDGLKFKSTATLNNSQYDTDIFNKKGTQGYSQTSNNRSLYNNQNTTTLWENLFTYHGFFNKHAIVAMLGQSIEKYKSRRLGAGDSNFPDENILINPGTGVDSWGSSSDTESALVSGMARVNYKFDGKYLATATFRTDGSSKFGPDRRWGYFPSAALAWIISDEKFMSAIKDKVNYLKLRGSLGKTGSQNLGYYDYMSLFAAAAYDKQPGIRPYTLGNPALQWEETVSTDLGLDYGFWGERIRGSLGYYQKTINNLIYQGSVPANSSVSTVNQNIGTISNKGWEFDVRVDVLKKRDMNLEVGFNIATNVGRVEKIDGVSKEIVMPYYYEYVKLVEGGKIGDWYGYKYGGRLYQNAEEIYAQRVVNPTTGAVQERRSIYDVPGSMYLMDLDGDGRVTAAADRTTLGNFNPKFFGGFNLQYSWKGLFASALFTYSYGAQRLWYYQYERSQSVGIRNHYNMVMDAYNFNPTQSASHPTMSYASSMYQISDFFIHDASFIRLNALNFSYRLPSKWFKNSFVSNIELSVSGSNLFTITKYPGFDPQGNFSTTPTAATNQDVITIGHGVDNSTYPSARTYNFGIKFTFK